MWDSNATRKGMWDDFKKIEKKVHSSKVKKEKTTLEKCSICMNNMVGDIHELVCRHQFHHHCIKDLFCVYMSDRCPLCRANYKYQPSKKRKPKRRMRNKMLKYNTNQWGVMTRQKCADMHYYFVSRKVSMPFLKQMIEVLIIRYDYNFIKYFGDTIFLYTQEKPSCTGGLVYQNRDLKIKDFYKQEAFRQALIPLPLRIEDNESDSEDESDDEDEVLTITFDQIAYIEQLDQQEYDDDVRICNMYNVEQKILDHLYHITPGFNVSYLENKAIRLGHISNLQNWVRGQIFIEAIDAEEMYLQCDIHVFDDLIKMVPDNEEWITFITDWKDDFNQQDEYWTFMRSVTHPDGGIVYEEVMDWFSNNMH